MSDELLFKSPFVRPTFEIRPLIFSYNVAYLCFLFLIKTIKNITSLIILFCDSYLLVKVLRETETEKEKKKNESKAPIWVIIF